jgi:hypothetical protein
VKWIKLDTGKYPPEHVDILVCMSLAKSPNQHVMLGRNVYGVFAVYDANDDRYREYSDPPEYAWNWITHYCVIDKPSDNNA